MRAAHILLSSGFSIRNCLASFKRVDSIITIHDNDDDDNNDNDNDNDDDDDDDQ